MERFGGVGLGGGFGVGGVGFWVGWVGVKCIRKGYISFMHFSYAFFYALNA